MCHGITQALWCAMGSTLEALCNLLDVSKRLHGDMVFFHSGWSEKRGLTHAKLGSGCNRASRIVTMELASKSGFMKMTWESAEDLRCNLKGYETALERISVGPALNARDMFEEFKQCGDLLHLAMGVAGK
mmetsp:Transcript_60566/g.187649  ORF Transcript_60566/g.187649 Transcript_60566/m.187649 type:complete len:130 (+) Transcript_60566:45-434(+)